MSLLARGAIVAFVAAVSCGCQSSDSTPPDGGSNATTAAPDLEGSWGPSGKKEGQPAYTFEPDGAFAGWDGCNSSSGTWSTKGGGEIILEAKQTTLVECPTLARPARYFVVDGALQIEDDEGEIRWTLKRESN